MSTVSIVFLLATVVLLSCVIALHASIQIQLKHERHIASKMRMAIVRIDEAMQSDDRGKESY